MTGKKEISNFAGIKGECRGVTLKTDAEYIISNYGQEALKKVESQLREWEHPINYDSVNETGLYPMYLRLFSLLAIKEALKLNDNNIIKMGNTAPRFSLIIKSFIRVFLTIDTVMDQFSNGWAKHYTEGSLDKIYFNKKEKKAVLGLHFKLHPLFCLYMKGYLLRSFQMLLPDNKVTARETKCVFKGDEYNEYTITWK